MKKGIRNVCLVGESYFSSVGTAYTIIGYMENPRKRKIEFLNGEIKIVDISSIKKGNIQSKYDKTVYGVGCIGDFSEIASNHPLYYRWTGMLGRCYSKKHPQYKSYGQKGIFVEDYLQNFANYVSFISSLDNYFDLIDEPTKWQIDKDKKGGGCYSRKTISIISTQENIELENSVKRQGIDMLTQSGTYLKSFESITQAEKVTGIHRANIARGVKTGFSAGGYKWRTTNE